MRVGHALVLIIRLSSACTADGGQSAGNQVIESGGNGGRQRPAKHGGIDCQREKTMALGNAAETGAPGEAASTNRCRSQQSDMPSTAAAAAGSSEA